MLAVAAGAAVWAAADGASASITVATNAQRPALRVDAKGWAEVTWTSGGRRQSLLVPPTGRVFPGRRLAGADVSRPTTEVKLPFARVVRRTPDGRFWALQAWRVAKGGPIELRFSRWRGAPTEVDLTATPRRQTELLSGRATFQGRPVTGYSPTPAGTRILLAAALDCFTCLGSRGWVRFTQVRTRANGSFAATVPLRARAARYRVTIAGPNRGATYAPDASAVVESSR